MTPSYNQGQFIEESMRSVLLQGYPDLEYIVIDGGSSDDSVDKIRRYEQWLEFWVSEPDSGQSNAINKGWRRSRGDVIAWLNSDDIYAPSALCRAAVQLAANPKAAVVYGKADEVDEESRVTGRMRGWPFDLHTMLEMGRNHVPQPAAFVRRRAVDQVGMLDEDLHLAMDHDLWLRMALEHEVTFTGEVWASFRCHSESKSVALRQEFALEYLEIVTRLFSRHSLPERISGIQHLAYSSAHIMVARSAALKHQYLRTLWHLARALVLAPAHTFHESKGWILETLLGRRAVDDLRRLVKRQA